MCNDSIADITFFQKAGLSFDTVFQRYIDEPLIGIFQELAERSDATAAMLGGVLGSVVFNLIWEVIVEFLAALAAPVTGGVSEIVALEETAVTASRLVQIAQNLRKGKKFLWLANAMEKNKGIADALLRLQKLLHGKNSKRINIRQERNRVQNANKNIWTRAQKNLNTTPDGKNIVPPKRNLPVVQKKHSTLDSFDVKKHIRVGDPLPSFDPVKLAQGMMEALRKRLKDILEALKAEKKAGTRAGKEATILQHKILDEYMESIGWTLVEGKHGSLEVTIKNPKPEKVMTGPGAREYVAPDRSYSKMNENGVVEYVRVNTVSLHGKHEPPAGLRPHDRLENPQLDKIYEWSASHKRTDGVKDTVIAIPKIRQ